MNIGIICNVSSNVPEGFIAIDSEDNKIGYVTVSEDLDNIIDVILEKSTLNLPVEEEFENNKTLRYESISKTHPHYISALNYILPNPWRILGVRYEKDNMESILNECNNYLEGFNNE